MAVDPNFGFLARQLALSDFPELEVGELDGGCTVGSDPAWIASWDPAAITDADALVEEQVSRFKGAGIRKWLLLSGLEQPKAGRAQLEEALYLAGFADLAQGPSNPPDQVLVLGRPEFPAKPPGIELAQVQPGDQLLYECLNAAGGGSEDLGFQFSGMTDSPLSGMRYCLALLDAKPAGLVAWREVGIVCRICLVFVEAAHRRQGIGAALVNHAVQSAGQSGAAVATAWTRQKGSLRYFFSALGFSEQLRAATYAQE